MDNIKYHNIDPVYDENSKILILGSFPSVKSREEEFYYAHPQNRFWRVLSAVTGSDTPVTVNEKRELLIKNRIALWDCLSSCEIKGSSDASIRAETPNDIGLILSKAEITTIFTNGTTAYKYYNKYLREQSRTDAILLPSTSPSNASKSLDALIREWSIIKNYL